MVFWIFRQGDSQRFFWKNKQLGLEMIVIFDMVFQTGCKLEDILYYFLFGKKY